jgi:hypothetical protein
MKAMKFTKSLFKHISANPQTGTWPPGAPIGIRGEGLDGKTSTVKACTLRVSPQGGVLLLTAPIRQGQPLTLVNHATQKEKECRVTHTQAWGPHTSVAEVAFSTDDPAFWRTVPTTLPGSFSDGGQR